MFATNLIKHLRGDFWTNAGICFYLDGVSFTHKYNPHDEARCHGSKAWKKASEAFEGTAKGKKEGTGGRMSSFYVAISYEKGVVMCEQYEGQVNVRLFADIVKEKFPETFYKSTNNKNMLFLQDGVPSQNSAVAKSAFEFIGCKVFSIPARSPDMNPIENLFNIIRSKLRSDALEQKIIHETFEKVSARVKKSLEEFPVDIINKTIESMPSRMKCILKGNGHRTKY